MFYCDALTAVRHTVFVPPSLGVRDIISALQQHVFFFHCFFLCSRFTPDTTSTLRAQAVTRSVQILCPVKKKGEVRANNGLKGGIFRELMSTVQHIGVFQFALQNLRCTVSSLFDNVLCVVALLSSISAS